MQGYVRRVLFSPQEITGSKQDEAKASFFNPVLSAGENRQILLKLMYLLYRYIFFFVSLQLEN